MKTVAIIQARMGSTRLPGKVMKELCGRTVLAHVIERVRSCSVLDAVVIATTLLPADDVIVVEAERCGVEWYRGSEDDVLGRYYGAARQCAADIVVRITADCPLFDPVVLEKMLTYFTEERKGRRGPDYVSSTLRRTYPRGLDAEVFTYDALESAFHNAKKPYEREHVTPYIYQHPELFSLKGYERDDDLSELRWTLDTEEDFRLIQEIYNALYDGDKIFFTDEIIALMRAHPELARMNVHIEQKTLVHKD